MSEKHEDAEEVCPTCDGDGEVHSHNPRCWSCSGSGKVSPSKAADVRRREEALRRIFG